MAISSAIKAFGTLFARGDGGVGAGTPGFVEWGTTNAKIRIKWGVAGIAGNGKNITVVVSGSVYSMSITTSSISITVPTTATVAQVIANLEQVPLFDQYWQADFGASPGDGSGTITARTVTPTAGGTDGAEVFTTLAEIRNISGPDLSQGTNEVTHMESPSRAREYIAGLLEAGQISLDMGFIPGLAGHQQLITDMAGGARRNWKVTWPDASYAIMSMIPVNVGPQAPVDGVITASVAFKISGWPTFSW